MLKAKEYNDKAKVQANENAFDWEEMHNRGITQAVEQYASESNGASAKTESKPAEEKATNNEDHAPRVLTGDCKVKIRKSN